MKSLILLQVMLLLPVIMLSQDAGCELLFSEQGIEYAYPRLSKDNNSILLQSNRTGNWQLYVLDIKTKKLNPIFKDACNNNFPDWSTDNKSIAYVSDRDGNEEIYLVHNDDTIRVTNDPGRDIHPYFSPDGKYILFNSTRGNGSFDIYRYTIGSGKTEQLTSTPENETCARYSPDMKSIVYLKNSEESDDIYTLEMENFTSKNITENPAIRDGWPVFGNDGKWIWYSSMESGKFCVYRIKPDGTGKQKITEAKAGEEDARVNISADGKMMIFNKRSGKTIDIRKYFVN